MAPLRGVRTHFVQVGGKPFDVVVSPNNFGFVSLRNNAPLVVMNTAKFVPTVVQQVPWPTPRARRSPTTGSTCWSPGTAA